MTANLYPPSTTNPADSATPQRTIALDTRGTILPGVNLVMANLQKLYPRRIFPESQRQQGALDAYMHMLDEIREAPQPMITTR